MAQKCVMPWASGTPITVTKPGHFPVFSENQTLGNHDGLKDEILSSKLVNMKKKD